MCSVRRQSHCLRRDQARPTGWVASRRGDEWREGRPEKTVSAEVLATSAAFETHKPDLRGMRKRAQRQTCRSASAALWSKEGNSMGLDLCLVRTTEVGPSSLQEGTQACRAPKVAAQRSCLAKACTAKPQTKRRASYEQATNIRTYDESQQVQLADFP